MASWEINDKLLSIKLEEYISHHVIEQLRNVMRPHLNPFNNPTLEDLEVVNRASRMSMSLLLNNEIVDISSQDSFILDRIEISPQTEEIFKILNNCRLHLLQDGGPEAIVSCDVNMKAIARIHNS
jgi:hypothetical protein